MTVDIVVVGDLDTNCYIISNNQHCIIIDPGDEPEKIIDFIDKNKLVPIGYLITHHHYDHVSALNEIINHYPISLMSSNDQFNFDVIETPGHKEDALCFYFKNDGVLISGDTLFYETVGRQDLPGGNSRQLLNSLSILKALPPATTVYPGHGPSTTINHELKHNIWLR